MKVLLLGSTGMLGQALLNSLQKHNFNVITASRNNSNYNIDFLLDDQKLAHLIACEKPQIVINAVALVDLSYCQVNPEKAYLINSRLPGLISEICSRNNIYFIQISTDHFYSDDGRVAHTENHPVKLLNEYARTKYAGECFSLAYDNTLVVRTNLVGFRNKEGILTFVEWIIDTLERKSEIIGFNDFYTSSIDVRSFSEILIELIEMKYTGLINIASYDVTSKYEFIHSLASLLGKEKKVKIAQLNSVGGIKRANSLGLDVTKLKNLLLEKKIPSSEEVTQNIYEQYREGAYYVIQK